MTIVSHRGPLEPSPIVPSFEAAGAHPRIGLILLSTDLTSELEFARHCPPDDAAVYASRIAYENPTTPANLELMLPRLEAGAGLLLPGETLGAIYYACTAATVVIGEEPIRAAVQRAKPGVPVVTPPGAARLALESLGARRISILTPYLPETSAPIAAWFEAAGFDVRNLAYMGLEDDRQMARMSRESIVEAAVAALSDDADALFISCTALRSVAAVAEIERLVGRPVVTSNQAGLWLSRRLAGVARPLSGLGRLFADPESGLGQP